jgi:hypothetical protein
LSNNSSSAESRYLVLKTTRRIRHQGLLIPYSKLSGRLGKDLYAFEFVPAYLGKIAVLMKACRQPHDEIPWRAVECRLAWRHRSKKAHQ